MAEREGGAAANPFGVVTRSFELREAAPEAVPAGSRLVIDTGVLAQTLGARGGGEAAWAKLRGPQWERALQESGLMAVLQSPQRDLGGSGLGARINEIRAALENVRRAELDLGRLVDADAPRDAAEVDLLMVLLCISGALAALAPSGLRYVGALILMGVALRPAWRLWAPRARIQREQFAQARRDLALAVLRFLERTWVVALGDQVLESAPHAVYFEHRLTDLDNARAARQREATEVRALIARVAAANAQLGQPSEDAETRRLGRQIEELAVRTAQIDRVRAHCQEQFETYRAQIERQRAIAARRALSSRVASVVDPGDDSSGQEVAEIEVDIGDLVAEIRTLDVETGNADAELRSVLEVAGAGLARAASARRRA